MNKKGEKEKERKDLEVGERHRPGKRGGEERRVFETGHGAFTKAGIRYKEGKGKTRKGCEKEGKGEPRRHGGNRGRQSKMEKNARRRKRGEREKDEKREVDFGCEQSTRTQ